MAQFGMSSQHKAALDSNRFTLTQDLYVDPLFLAVLVEHKILPSGQKQRLNAIPTAERSKRAAWVISFIKTKGARAMKAFIYALMTTSQCSLADMLDKDIADQWRKEHPEEGESVEPGEDVNVLVKDDFTNVDRDLIVREPDKHILKQKQMDKNAYTVGKGRLFIINNHTFNNVKDPSYPEFQLKNRFYSAIDFSNLNVMEDFSFDVEFKENIEAKILADVLDEEIAYIKAHHTEIDCYMFVVLSYGTQHDITMVDGKRLNPDRITQRFSGTELPELVQKPKIFIIHTDHVGINKDTEVVDGPSASSGEQYLHPDTNFYIITSKAYIKEEEEKAVPWFEEGTLFIRFLTYVIAKYAHQEHFKDMVLKTCALMNEVREKHKKCLLSHITKQDNMKLEPYLVAKDSMF